MKLLKNTEQWDLYFDLETDQNVIRNTFPKIVGWITYLEGNMSMLYVENSILYFRYKDVLYNISNKHYIRLNIISKLDVHSVKKEFLLYEKSKKIYY